MASRWREAAVRSLLLFGLSSVLVAGFWFHAEFYALGLLPLLVLGSVAVILVMAGMRAVLTGHLAVPGRKRALVLDVRDAGPVRARTRTLLVLPAPAGVPREGSLCAARSASGDSVGLLRIARVSRKLPEDLTLEDAAAAGYRDLGELVADLRSRGAWRPGAPLALVWLGPAGAAP